MKKSIWALGLSLAMVTHAYEVLVFSDTHYDSMAVRDPQQELSQPRQKELERNLRNWRENIPDLLTAAQHYTQAHKIDFIVHVGDLTQGDCGSAALQKKSFENALQIFNEKLAHPFYFVKGNHDIRGPGAIEAWNAVAQATLDKSFKTQSAPGAPANYALLHQGDLYIFFDCIKPDVEFVTKTLAAHTTSRHLFFVTHYPLLPCIPAPFGKLSLYATAGEKGLRQLTQMLAARNAIVLCGHIHRTVFTQYRSEAGSITQFSNFSIVTKPQTEPAITQELTADILPTMMSKTISEKHKKYLLDEYQDKIQKVVYHNTGATGFNVLEVKDDGVWIELRGSGQVQNRIKLKLSTE